MHKNNAAGILLGLGCGDALGRPVEFTSASRIERTHGTIDEMLGDGTHGKPAGTVTDDTELAVCIAESLHTKKEFDPADVADRFLAWYQSEPFDVGLMTAESLRRIDRGERWDEAGRIVWEARPEGQNAGNGSVMRCAPYAIAFADRPDRLADVSRSSSAITHADPRCTAGCAILNRTLAGLAAEEPDPLQTALDELEADTPDELLEALRVVPEAVDPGDLQSSGYVVHTLQSALYHGLTADTAKAGIVEAVAMGRDTDTVGAVTGAVVDARFGATALPDDWVEALRFDDDRRSMPAWWPDDRPAEAVLREFASDLTTNQ